MCQISGENNVSVKDVADNCEEFTISYLAENDIPGLLFDWEHETRGFLRSWRGRFSVQPRSGRSSAYNL